MPVNGQTSVRVYITSPFSPKNVVYGQCLVTLPLTINEHQNGSHTTLIFMENHSGASSIELGISFQLLVLGLYSIQIIVGRTCSVKSNVVH